MADIQETIALYCRQLRLSSNLAERALTLEGVTNQEYLINLLSNEVTYRRERRIMKLLNTAGFPKLQIPVERYAHSEISGIAIPLLRYGISVVIGTLFPLLL
ncbi:MAG: hypothetical protein RR593_08745 [Hungatella sp.]